MIPQKLVIIDLEVKCKDGTLAIDRLRKMVREGFKDEPEIIKQLFRVAVVANC